MSIFIGNSDIIKYILSQTEDNLEIIGDDKNINIIDIRDKAISFNSERYIIDLLSLDNKEEEIVKVARQIKLQTKADIIFFAKGYTGNEKILISLAGLGFKKIITSDNLSDMNEHYLLALSQDDEFNFDNEILESREKKRTEFLNSNPDLKRISDSIEQKEENKLKIAVVGAQGRIGVTTVSLNLMKMFNFIDDGCSCYIECNKTGFTESLISNMKCSYNSITSEIKIEENSLFRDVKKIKDIEKNGFTKIIYDFGVLNESNIEAVIEKDIVIAVIGAKTLEIEPTTELIKKTNEYPNFAYLYNFIAESEREAIKKGQGNLQMRTFFMGYAPDELALSLENREMFGNLIDDMLNIMPKTEKKKNVFRRLFGK